MITNKVDQSSIESGNWVTIGTFDGVHVGHQELIKQLVSSAHHFGRQAIVITFFPHPSEILGGENGPLYLTNPSERERLLTQLGADIVITQNFNSELAHKTAQEFIHLIYQNTPFTDLIIGHDFRFGSNRTGDLTLLQKLGKEIGFDIKVVQPFRIAGEIVSSSLIRRLLKQGDVQMAADMLGRCYVIEGSVIHGDGRGKHIGIPTANISVWPKQFLPKNGVYSVRVSLEKYKYPAVLSIGMRPTFYQSLSEQTIEAHILDFHREIYGKTLKVEFIQFLRDEKRYESAEQLIQQIQQDIQQTREVFKHATSTTNLSS